MSDRRSQRIRAQLRQHPNPRSRTAPEQLSWSAQMRRVYLPERADPPGALDGHAELARLLADQRKTRR